MYGSKVYPMKYVFGNSGLHWSIKKWCKILNTKISLYFIIQQINLVIAKISNK